jgi:hypothetical protein
MSGAINMDLTRFSKGRMLRTFNLTVLHRLEKKEGNQAIGGCAPSSLDLAYGQSRFNIGGKVA